MTVTVKHPFVSTVPDSTDTSLVRPTNWNADHTIVGLGTAAELNAGVANGVATLDSGGQVPLSQIPPLGDLNYQGTWNASTNSPTLTSSTGTKGYYYVVSVAGSTNLNGITDWKIGDWAVYNGTAWQKIDNTDSVTSVNGYTGAVNLTYTDVGAFPSTPTTGANSVVLRDANQNVSANSFFSNALSVAAAGTTTTLVASSTTNWSVTGSGGQTFQLPDATTLPVGATFTFNNNQTSGTIVVKNNSGTTVVTVQSGGFVTIYLLVNTPAAGSWDVHYEAPSNVSWSTNTLDYAGSITSATWNGNVVQVNRGGTGAATLTGYVKGNGTSAMTASTTVPSTDVTGLGTMSTQNANAVAVTGGAVDGTTVGSTTAAAGSFTTLNSSGNTRLGGLSGNQSLQVNNVASAVNYAQIVGGITTVGPTYSAQGTDTNINLLFSTKGTGQYFFSTGGGLQFGINSIASAVNYLQAAGAATGGAVGLNAQGIDTNINMGYFTKGSGFHFFYTNGNAQAAISNTASAVNYLNLTGAATGAAPTLSAQGSDTNIGLVLNGKGTGVVALGGSTVANSAAQFVPSTSGVNFLQFTGGATGVSPSFVSSGTDSAVGFNISTKGNANIAFFTNNFGNFSFIAKNVASAVNYIQTQGAVTTGAPEISAQGSDTNINLKLTPKGTGGVQFTGPLLPNNLAGTSGQVLTSAGAGAVPTWAAPVSSNITANGLFENNATISANYTIGSGNNAVSAGPITINSGVVVTVPSGSTWVVV